MKKPLKNALPRNQEKPSLRIGFVFDDTLDSFDGVSQYVKTLGKWYAQQGHQVKYLVGQTKLNEWHGGKVYSLSKNQKVSFNGNQTNIPLPASKKRINKVLKEEQFDILHVQVPYSPFMAQKVINQTNPNTAIIGTFHVLPGSWMSKYGSRILKLMYGRSLKRFDEVVAVSSAAAEFAKKSFGLNCDVVPNAVDVGRFSSAKPSSNKTENIVFLGRLVQRKGCSEIIKAFALLLKTRPQAKLIIAGKGPQLNKLQKLVFKLNLQKSVKFTGFVDEEDKPNLLASAVIACFPSLGGESFGIVLIEAMAAGAGVVVGGSNPGYSSVLKDQQVLLVDPKDHQNFAKRLDLLLSDKKLANQLHEWQLKEVNKYDVNTVGGELLKRYQVIIDKRNVKRHN